MQPDGRPRLREDGHRVPGEARGQAARGRRFVHSLFELSTEYDYATILRDRKIAILVSSEGQVLPAPQGYYVFPDGIIAEILEGGQIGALWGEEFSDGGGGFWSMC
ncbi:hypothetical protein OV079_52655 [Nannocystis pusilla]|uniref:Uncharacterized protein n=1 Tax=Nannocystis pusilla TaxID=889268 RepID=A0A9X3J481_9BACT|nr:hypothetical protein [Nannocystis pusilla]MCY1014035.1 hypothetical protein [Nannocystis pusilla]